MSFWFLCALFVHDRACDPMSLVCMRGCIWLGLEIVHPLVRATLSIFSGSSSPSMVLVLLGFLLVCVS